MSDIMDRINADIAKQTTIIGGFKAAMDGLAAQLRNMGNSGGASKEELLNLALDIETNNLAAQAALDEGVAPAVPPA